MVRNVATHHKGSLDPQKRAGHRAPSPRTAKAPVPDVRFYEHRLRRLANELLVTEERERRRLAVDLHDGPSQLIALAQIKLGVLSRSVDGGTAQALAEVLKVIDEANRSVRSLTFELNAPGLCDGELASMMRWLADDIQSRYGLTILLQDDGRAKPADEKTRTLIFRSVRELLINAAKHAQSDQVRVELRREGDDIHVTVEDDGVGMDPSAAQRKGCGLHHIRERLKLWGGTLRIESAPGRGMHIQLCVPIATEDHTGATLGRNPTRGKVLG
jgi:signal transduction histidine kinase